MRNDLPNLMRNFCNVMMPGHDNKRGYINVKKKVEEFGYDRRTYYNWKNGESYPRLRTMMEQLNKRGYTLKIVPWNEFYNHVEDDNDQ